jgi:DnaK suppressor protein
MRERAEQHLAEIDEVLQQLDMGLYGLCEKCGRPIEPERLAVLGHTTVCSQCAQRRR